MREQRMMSLVEHDYVQTATWRMGDLRIYCRLPLELSPPQHQTEMEVTPTPCRSCHLPVRGRGETERPS